MPNKYILECADGSFNVGSTKRDLDERLWEHSAGLGARYTRTRLPVNLVCSEEFDRIDDAFDCEKQVQGWGRAKRIALISGRFGALHGLARKVWRREA